MILEVTTITTVGYAAWHDFHTEFFPAWTLWAEALAGLLAHLPFFWGAWTSTLGYITALSITFVATTILSHYRFVSFGDGFMVSLIVGAHYSLAPQLIPAMYITSTAYTLTIHHYTDRETAPMLPPIWLATTATLLLL